jgi:hypothetical protein
MRNPKRCSNIHGQFSAIFGAEIDQSFWLRCSVEVVEDISYVSGQARVIVGYKREPDGPQRVGVDKQVRFSESETT